jgi:hypothetical protein
MSANRIQERNYNAPADSPCPFETSGIVGWSHRIAERECGNRNLVLWALILEAFWFAQRTAHQERTRRYANHFRTVGAFSKFTTFLICSMPVLHQRQSPI